MVFQKMGLMGVLVFSGARTLGQELTGFAALPKAKCSGQVQLYQSVLQEFSGLFEPLLSGASGDGYSRGHLKGYLGKGYRDNEPVPAVQLPANADLIRNRHDGQGGHLGEFDYTGLNLAPWTARAVRGNGNIVALSSYSGSLDKGSGSAGAGRTADSTKAKSVQEVGEKLPVARSGDHGY